MKLNLLQLLYLFFSLQSVNVVMCTQGPDVLVDCFLMTFNNMWQQWFFIKHKVRTKKCTNIITKQDFFQVVKLPCYC